MCVSPFIVASIYHHRIGGDGGFFFTRPDRLDFSVLAG